MNRKLVMALMLASGMAFAQAGGGSSGSATPDQQPSAQQPSTTEQQPPAQQPSTTEQQATPGTTQSTTATTSTAGQQTTVRGCLKQSGGNWTLASDNGQTINLMGDDATLKPNDAHQVEIVGTQSPDGSLQVSSVNVISDTCTNQQASGSTGAATAPATGPDQSSPASTQTPSSTQPPASTSSTGESMSGQSAAGSTTTTPSSTEQSTTGSAAPSSAEQPSGQSATSAPGAATSSDQKAAGASDQNANAAAGQKLPQTASPLPLLGLLGFGSLVSGLVARRRK